MKYCTKCKVNVHHQQTNCPLCGSYLDPANDNDNCAVYTAEDKKVTYPTLTLNTYVPFFRHKFNKILLVIAAISIALNLLLTPNHLWCYYVCLAVILAIFGVMSPINNKMKFVNIMRRNVFIATLLAVALELGICNWQFRWFVPEFVLPFVYDACIVTLDILIIFYRRTNRQLFSTLIYVTFYAICPQILFWISPLWNVTARTLIPFVSFFAALFNLIVVFIVCSRSLKEEMERNLNL